MATHVIYESAVGYAIYEVRLHEEVGQRTRQVQEAINDVTKFGAMVSLKGFLPFRDAAHALENANDVSEGVLNPHLNSLLELHLPKKKKDVVLGVSERGLAGAIKSSLGLECDTSERTLEIIRGLRLHAEKLIDGLQKGDVLRSQLGLGHAYSRAKVKFNVNRSDNMIIQAIALLDQLDKDVNLFAMRVREWYGWHFPELVRVVPDNRQYAKCVQVIGDKAKLSGLDDAAEIDMVGKIGEALDGDETRAKSVIDAGRASMGTDISPIDLINIRNFADRVLHLFNYRSSMQDYLREKMGVVAPNLAALIGDTVGARLISHAGSLTNLSKYPASTVQILGAEKALFRALKTKGNTPKYGLIYHSTFIGRAGQKSKGRISRFLANKCSIASRIDCFADAPTTRFGEALKDQVEERLAFYETGSAPTKNSEAMAKVLEKLRGEAAEIDADGDVVEGDLEDAAPKPKKKRKSEAADDAAKEEAGQKRKKHKSKEADVPAAPLSAVPPSTDAMEVDVTAAAADKAARKAAKKARKSAAATAITDPSGAVATTDPAEADASMISTTSTKTKKKKSRKSEVAEA